MESRAKLFGHAVHPILIPFPLGLLSTSIVFDVIHLLRGKGPWGHIAFWNIGAGVIGGLAAAVFGLIDWRLIPSGTHAKAVGLWHGGGNAVVVVLFSLSWLLRRRDPERPETTPIILSVLGGILAAVTGWLGG